MRGGGTGGPNLEFASVLAAAATTFEGVPGGAAISADIDRNDGPTHESGGIVGG